MVARSAETVDLKSVIHDRVPRDCSTGNVGSFYSPCSALFPIIQQKVNFAKRQLDFARIIA
jgi:hypothetical protein